MKLAGKVAFITGSSRGLGKAIALGLAQEGANIVVAARSESEQDGLPGTIHATAEEIRALGVRALAVRCDVTSEESVQDAVARAREEFGHIDILVNNAAAVSVGSLVDTPARKWDRVMSVNLGGAFLCCKHILPGMIERRSGNIINISSFVADHRPTLVGIAYAVSKAGIERLTTKLAQEVSQYNIAVNCLKPRHFVRTEGVKHFVPEKTWARFDTPDRMVRAALFLAQQDTQGVCGIITTDEQLLAMHGLA